ncbi:tumor necrosis factor receptor superfamily member 19 isoform X2 [Kogia breviceps]|uniref:tumor necrosis factor receptor superfamily member 19 isoform X2 n=1 Tax=Kogia breviceps TaxID=27615 RepID=UPI0034D2E35D
MAFKVLLEQQKAFFTVVVLLACLTCRVICETGGCGQQEFRNRSGNCVLCKQCGPGMELSKECGFGYGEDAQCVRCWPHRFKEDWGFQKCKPCLDCALLSRFQKANCSATRDAICGDCLPGFYRKTKLVGFQDMECVPCGDPPPPYKPHWSLRAQDLQYNGSELSCFDRPRLSAPAARACCQCRRDSAQTCGPVHPIPSACCDGACGVGPETPGCRVHSKAVLQDRDTGPAGEALPTFFGSLSRSICGEFLDAWPLMQNPSCGDDVSSCDSYPELPGEDVRSLSPESASSASLDSNSGRGLVGGAVPVQAHPENFTETTDLSRLNNSVPEPARTRDALTAGNQLAQERGDVRHLATQPSPQEAERTRFFLQ